MKKRTRNIVKKQEEIKFILRSDQDNVPEEKKVEK